MGIFLARHSAAFLSISRAGAFLFKKERICSFLPITILSRSGDNGDLCSLSLLAPLLKRSLKQIFVPLSPPWCDMIVIIY
ncbi:MAG: hypothetical protein B6I32_01170 [Desulfobacterium sp. 4572_20]|nr:MAG: hypothetical protein B6I32_01170 [Desulfobacterium sp. 4572_20]RLB25145.1 MAG: hypothetical protein DRG73_02530 [Deltaproteobacteria bacterium]